MSSIKHGDISIRSTCKNCIKAIILLEINIGLKYVRTIQYFFESFFFLHPCFSFNIKLKQVAKPNRTHLKLIN